MNKPEEIEKALENYYFVRKCVHYAWDKDLMEDFFFYFAGQEGIGPIKVSINCNDLFYWGCSDGEEVTPENFNLLEEAYEQLKPLYEVPSFVCSITLGLLFCCKARQMRPQTPYYYHIDRKYWDLFNACGKVREDQGDIEEYVTKKTALEAERKANAQVK